MGSWKYISFFPKHDEAINYNDVISVMRNSIFEIEKGYVRLGKKPDKSITEDKLGNLIIHQTSFQITLANHSIFMSCEIAFGIYSHITIGFPNKLFRNMDRTVHDNFWEFVLQLSKEGNIAYVLGVDDIPDDFNERFFYIDDTPCFDTVLMDGSKLQINLLWICEKDGKFPEGISNNLYCQESDIQDCKRYYLI